MGKTTDKKTVNLLALLFASVYMVSYITRINFGAIISEMEDALSMSRSLISVALTGNSIAYGFGQLISGYSGDNFSPKKLITFGFIITVSMNILIPFCDIWYEFLTVWCINGFAQSFMWPPLVKIMAEILSENDYKHTITKVSWGSSIGTMAVYLFSPLLIGFAGWKSVFFFSALCGIIMIIVWNAVPAVNNIKISPASENQNKKNNFQGIFTPIMLGILITVVLQGMLKDGVTTWMPSYIADTYNLGTKTAILTGVIIPIFNMGAVTLGTKIHIKYLKNPCTCAGVFFVLSTIASGLLLMVTGKIAVMSVILSAVITGCMHGINLMLVCMIPAYFKDKGNVSTVSGIVNCASYIGTAISTYGVAVISQNLGWGFSIFSWMITSLFGGILSFICIRGIKNLVK